MPDQINLSANLATIVLRSDKSKFHVGRIAQGEGTTREKTDWIVVQGLPETSASLTPSGHDVVFVSGT